ncbi:hypothetical protein YPPY19_4506, partial [Yersinia pestis PY-19]
MIERLF